MPKDYFKGQILHRDKVVSEIYGNYMGYIDFDGIRYWDAREMKNFEPVPVPKTELSNQKRSDSLPVVLQSDTTLRIDSIALIQGDVN